MVSSYYQLQDQSNIFLKDYIVHNPCKETISSLSLSSINRQSFCAFGSWDGLVNVYSVSTSFIPTQSFSMNEVKSFPHNSPLLSTAFQDNAPLIIYGSLSGSVGLIDLVAQKDEQIYSHEIGAREVKWLNQNVLISGGWDGFLLMRDLRMNSFISTHQFANRINSIDVQGSNILIGLSERQFALSELSSTKLSPSVYNSSLRYQITKVALMPSSKAFVIGSIAGGIEVKHIDNNTNFDTQKQTITNSNDYCFVTHVNDNNEVYPINFLQFNPSNNSLVSGGGDGLCIFWDIEGKKKLSHGYMDNIAPLTSGAFAREGSLFVYSTGHDYYKGKEYANKNIFCPKIGLHSFT